MSEQSRKSVSEVLDAATQLQVYIDPTNELLANVEDGIRVQVITAVQRVWNAAKAFSTSGAVSDDEEEDEDDDGFENGDMGSAEIATGMVEDVKVDPSDFADLVTTMYVHFFTPTRKPKAAAVAIVHLLQNNIAMMHKWQKLFLAVDGLGRCGYILKQNWLDDPPWNDDADPREAVLRILDIFSYNNPVFCVWMSFRGNCEALAHFIGYPHKLPHLRPLAQMLLERVNSLSECYDNPKDAIIASKNKEIQDLQGLVSNMTL